MSTSLDPSGIHLTKLGLTEFELAGLGLAVLATAHWPSREPGGLPPVAGFVTSAFSPLVATVADLCLLPCFGPPPAAPAYGDRTAIVLASSTGDLATAAAVASAVQAGRRVPPLLFYQSNLNAVVGHVAARWQLSGPVICAMPGRPASALAPASALEAVMTDALASAMLLVEGGDAGAALVIAANAYLDDTVECQAILIGPASWPTTAQPAATESLSTGPLSTGPLTSAPSLLESQGAS